MKTQSFVAPLLPNQNWKKNLSFQEKFVYDKKFAQISSHDLNKAENKLHSDTKNKHTPERGITWNYTDKLHCKNILKLVSKNVINTKCCFYFILHEIKKKADAVSIKCLKTDKILLNFPL